MAPNDSSPMYRFCYAIRCAAAAAMTAALAAWSVFVMDDPKVLAMTFAAYFVFDTICDLVFDLFFRSGRRHLDLVIMVHHVLGVAAMYYTPRTDTCLLAWKLVTVAEFSTPLLYLSNFYRFSQLREAPYAVSGAMIVAWPFLRLMAPMLSLFVQARAYLTSSDHCGVFNLPTTVAYIAMNAHFLSLISRRHMRNHAKEDKKHH